MTTVIDQPSHYQYIAESYINNTILQSFITTLTSNKNKFNLKCMVVLFRNFFLIIMLKMILENCKSYVENFKLTELISMRYIIQKFKVSQIVHTLNHLNNKWHHNGKTLCTNALTIFFENHDIPISKAGTYYFRESKYIIKVKITKSCINFYLPNVSSIIRYFNTNIIQANMESLFGNKTALYTLINNKNIIKLESMNICNVYPHPQYREIHKSLETNIMYEELLNLSPSPYCININGSPGTGKTTFAIYAASTGLFDRIVICNLMKFTNMDFSSLHDRVDMLLDVISNTSQNSKILVVYDEIDKWLSSFIDNKILSMFDESRCKKSQSTSSGDIISESYEKMSQDEENVYRKQMHNTFLDQLYNIIDKPSTNNRRYYYVFNTNNINYVFKDVDSKYDALRDRIQSYEFACIRKQHIIDFLNYYDTCIQNLKNPLSNEITTKISPLINKITIDIPDDLDISYRKLYHFYRANSFDINNTVSSLVSYYGKKN